MEGRVFRRREGLLFVPAGRIVRRVLITDRAAAGSPRRPVEQWHRPEPYWLDEQQSESIRARCRCCPPSEFSTADMLDHLCRGRRVMRVDRQVIPWPGCHVIPRLAVDVLPGLGWCCQWWRVDHFAAISHAPWSNLDGT